MKSFLKGLGNQKTAGLVGKVLKVGPYTIRVESSIGEGGFASIYKVRDQSNGAVYALKHMRLNGDKEAIADCQTEIDTLKRLRANSHVLTLHATAFAGLKGQEQEAFLLLDLCHDTLVEFLRHHEHRLSDKQVLAIFGAVADAVAAMHSCQPPLAHRDLKAENVLLHQAGHWVLCDFGSTTAFAGVYESANAIMVAEELIRKYTTPAYRAPEMFDLYSRERIDVKADIWALGCLLFFIAFGKLPFEGDAKLQVLNGDYRMPRARPEGVRALIRDMLTVSPAARPTIDQVVQRVESLTRQPVAGSPLAASPAAQMPGPQQALQQQPQPLSSSPRSLVSTPAAAVVGEAATRAPAPLASAQPSGPPPPCRSVVRQSPPASQASPAGHASSGRPRDQLLPAAPSQEAATSSRPSGTSPGAAGHFWAGRSSDTTGLAPSRQRAPASPHSAGGTPTFQAQQHFAPGSPQVAEAGTGAGSSGAHEVEMLRQQVAKLQATVAAQQATIQQLQAENFGRASQTKHQQAAGSQGSLVSLDADPCWDAFGTLRDAEVPNGDATGPGSPSRRVPGPQEEFIKATKSNIESVKELLPAFDPFGIQEGSEANSEGAGPVDEEEGASTPLSPDGKAGKAKVPWRQRGQHRRTSSEPTHIDSWNPTFS